MRSAYNLKIVIIIILLCTLHLLKAQIQDRPRPKEWKTLVSGARFQDRFLPMIKGKIVTPNNWGSAGVMNRYVSNGIEDKIRSYWGGNILYANDGKYHLYVCGWLESSEKGHMEWPHSIVYHTVSDSSHGPFKIKDTVGPGHNPEIFISQNGQYVIYVIDGYYISDSYNGPWKYQNFTFNPRDRNIIEGLSNLTFAKREDGSNLMICRGGGVWFSQTGLSEYQQVSDKRVYPDIEGRFEDPVVWRDNVQYNLIVNDWFGRTAFYQRSKDGVNWITDPGEAYSIGIAMHDDGVKENWFKYERIKILQDKYGRAYQANFAVIDTLKLEDKGRDKHSSKNIIIPLNKGMLMEMVNTKFPNSSTPAIKIKILNEEGFDPNKELDIKSLRFGVSGEVNFGRGSKAISMTPVKDGVIISFENKNHGLTVNYFAPKLIGKSKSKKMVYAYTRVPWIKYNPAILSAKKPVFTTMGGGKQKAVIEVQNFGLSNSIEATLNLYVFVNNQKTRVGHATIPPLKPYQKTEIIDYTSIVNPENNYKFQLTIDEGNSQEYVFNFTTQVIQ